MRLNLFARNEKPEPEQPSSQQQGAASARPPTGRTFPADEVVWGIVIRNGFDELDDPWYHRGTTQHAYLEGNDNVAICGFRPPQSGPRTRRRSRLGMPSAGEHPMCGSCARMVVAPRPRVPVPVQVSRPPVAVPVARPAGQPAPTPVAVPVSQPVVAAPPPPTAPLPATPFVQPAKPQTSPWVRNRTDAGEGEDNSTSIEFGTRHDSGLLKRGIHTEIKD
jgi:hypothetical protein